LIGTGGEYFDLFNWEGYSLGIDRFERNNTPIYDLREEDNSEHAGCLSYLKFWEWCGCFKSGDSDGGEGVRILKKKLSIACFPAINIMDNVSLRSVQEICSTFNRHWTI